jgi:hypothetical protein
MLKEVLEENGKILRREHTRHNHFCLEMLLVDEKLYTVPDTNTEI